MLYNGFGYEWLRVLTLNFASTHQIEKLRGLSEVGENKKLIIAIVCNCYFFLIFVIFNNGMSHPSLRKYLFPFGIIELPLSNVTSLNSGVY